MSGLRRGIALTSAGLALLVALTAGPEAWIPFLVSVGLGMAAASWLLRRFGGVTGDVLGAVEQISEISFLVAATSIVPGGLSWA